MRPMSTARRATVVGLMLPDVDEEEFLEEAVSVEWAVEVVVEDLVDVAAVSRLAISDPDADVAAIGPVVVVLTVALFETSLLQ